MSRCKMCGRQLNDGHDQCGAVNCGQPQIMSNKQREWTLVFSKDYGSYVVVGQFEDIGPIEMISRSAYESLKKQFDAAVSQIDHTTCSKLLEAQSYQLKREREKNAALEETIRTDLSASYLPPPDFPVEAKPEFNEPAAHTAYRNHKWDMNRTVSQVSWWIEGARWMFNQIHPHTKSREET